MYRELLRRRKIHNISSEGRVSGVTYELTEEERYLYKASFIEMISLIRFLGS